MKTFHYEGLSASGAKVEGVVEAFDRSDAVVRARENCSRVVNIEPVRNSKMDKLMNADVSELLTGGKIKIKALSLLCSQMAIELKAGLPLVTSLKLVAENEQDKHMQKILNEVGDDVQAGNGLADSFALRGPALPNSFIETIRAGEESGKLDECFDRLKTYYDSSAAVSTKVSNAMIYPIMVIGVAVLVIGIIMVTAVPVFVETFADMGSSLPLPTRILIAVSNFMTSHGILLISIIVALILGLYLFGKTDSGKRAYARLGLTVPGIKLVSRMQAASQLSSTLATMLAAGLPMVLAIQITAGTLSNVLVSDDVLNAAQGVLEGRRMSDGLRKSKWFPNLLVEMTAVGEETGKLEDTLNVVSDYYTKEVDTAVKRALEILNPVITMVLALIVVFILLSVYMPLFSMYGSI